MYKTASKSWRTYSKCVQIKSKNGGRTFPCGAFAVCCCNDSSRMCLFALSKVCSSPSALRTGQTLLLCVGPCIKRALIQTGSPANGGSAHDSRLPEASVEFVYRSNSGAGTNINILLRQPPRLHSHHGCFICSTLIISWMLISFSGPVDCDSLWAELPRAHPT